MKKLILTLVSAVISVTGFSQWYQLPFYKLPSGYQGPTCVLQDVIPAANGVILYAWQRPQQGSSGEQCYIMKSINDLLTASFKSDPTTLLGENPPYRIYAQNSISYGYSLLGSGSRCLYYSSNDFGSFVMPQGCLGPHNTRNSSSISAGFVYSFYQDTASTDTVFIYCYKKSPTSLTVVKNTTYTLIDDFNSQFVNDSTGFIVMKSRANPLKYHLLRTADYGKTWSEKYTDSLKVITAFHFPSPLTGYMVFGNGSFVKTTDGGSTWSSPTSITTGTLASVSFANDTLGYSGGGSGILFKTINGGTNWTTEVSGTGMDITRVFAFPGDIAYYVNSSKSIYKNIPPLEINEESLVAFGIRVYPNPSSGTLLITADLSNANVAIVNQLGMEVKKFEDHDLNKDISVQDLPDGIYYLTIQTPDLKRTEKFVIMR